MIDELFLKYMSDLALGQDDHLVGQVFYSLNEDCQRHRQWSQALTRTAIEDTTANHEVIQAWIDKCMRARFAQSTPSLRSLEVSRDERACLHSTISLSRWMCSARTTCVPSVSDPPHRPSPIDAKSTGAVLTTQRISAIARNFRKTGLQLNRA